MIKIQSVAKRLGNRIWKPDKKYFLTLDWGKQCTDGQGDADSWDVQRLIPSQSLGGKWLIFLQVSFLISALKCPLLTPTIILVLTAAFTIASGLDYCV